VCQVDISDPRFSAIYENPLYNVDPSAPEFKRSKTMEAILDEKVKRRTKQKEGFWRNASVVVCMDQG